MFLDILLGSKATWRILVLLSESPGGRLTAAEIKRFTHLGNNSLAESLKDLLAHRIITAKKNGKMTYGLDLSNETVMEILSLCKLERKGLNNLPYSYSLILREYVRGVMSEIVPQRIILFGSVAKRVFREDSDIDIALVIREEMPVKARLEIEEVADKLRKRFGKEIQQHIFTAKEFEKSRDKLVLEIKRDGIDLL